MEGGRRAGGAGYGHGKEVVGRQPEPEPDIIWLFTAKYEPLPMVFQLHTPCTVLSIFRTQKKRDLVVAHQDCGPKTPLTKGNDSDTKVTFPTGCFQSGVVHEHPFTPDTLVQL